MASTDSKIHEILQATLDSLDEMSRERQLRREKIEAIKRETERTLHEHIIKDEPEEAECGRRAMMAANIVDKERELRACLKRFPSSRLIAGALGVLLWSQDRNHDEVEQLFRICLERAPEDEISLVNLSWFLQDRGRFVEAAQILRRGLSIHPESPLLLRVAAEIAFMTGDFEFSRQLALRGLHSPSGLPLDFYKAELCWLIGVASRVLGLDDTQALGRLKSLLSGNFSRMPSKSGQYLGGYQPHLKPEDFEFYSKAADAIGHREKMAVLERDPRWKSIAPIPVDASWQDP